MHGEIDKKQKQRKKLSPKEKRLVTKEDFQGLLGSIDEKVRLIRYLNENYQWDFFMAVFMESDQVGHGFWRDQRKVKKVYQKLDDALGEVFSLLPEDSLKIIVSDHGFQWIRGHFFLDEWLYRKGYAKKTFEPDEEAKKLLKNLEKFKESFSKKPGRHMGKFGYQPKIDYKDSKAYLYSGISNYGYGIRINLKGRESYGVVELQDYQSLRGELIAELKKIREPGTNRKIFSKVLKKEDVIGDVAEDDAYAASDIYFLPNNMDYAIIIFDKSNRLYKKINDGFHRKEGIFFALGEEFKKGFDAGKLSILDITPNILHIMGLEVPEDMDGKVRKEIFTNGSESYQRKVAFGQPSQRKAAQKRLSRREEEEIKKRLAALGYME